MQINKYEDFKPNKIFTTTTRSWFDSLRAETTDALYEAFVRPSRTSNQLGCRSNNYGKKRGFFLLKGGIRGISPGLGQHRNVCICIATIQFDFC